MAALRTENVAVSLLCVPWCGRRGPGAAFRLPLWAFYGLPEWRADEKWRSLQAPLLGRDFALGSHIYLKKTFYVMGPRLIFVPISMNIWSREKKNGCEFFLEYKAKTVCSRCYFTVWQRGGAQKPCVLDVFFLYRGFTSRAAGNLHSSHRFLQLSVPYCINPSHLSCVCLNIRLSSAFAAALRWENTSRN